LETAVKIHLDADRCEGYGFCEEKAPQLVELDDEGDLNVLVADELDSSDVDAAHKAVRSCPVAALRLIESHDS
jgi:ferredoxin